MEVVLFLILLLLIGVFLAVGTKQPPTVPKVEADKSEAEDAEAARKQRCLKRADGYTLLGYPREAAELYMAAEEFNKAAEAYLRLEDHHGAGRAYYKAALAALAGPPDTAVGFFMLAGDAFMDHEEARRTYYKVWRAEGEPTNQGDARQYQDAANCYGNAHNLLVGAEGARAVASRKCGEAFMRRAEALQSSGAFCGAADAYKAAAVHIADGQAYESAAECYLKGRNPRKAALCYLEVQDFDKAASSFECAASQCKRSSEESAAYYRMSAETYVRAKNHRRAMLMYLHGNWIKEAEEQKTLIASHESPEHTTPNHEGTE